MPEDLAQPILAADPSLSQDERATLWDVFHSKNPQELVQALHTSAALPETKYKLLESKHLQQPLEAVPPREDNPVIATLQKMKGMDAETLALADKFPNAFKEMVKEAAKPPEKPAGESSAAGKGKTATPAAPRASGAGAPASPNMEGWTRFLGQDGKNYRVHPEDLEEAQRRGLVKQVL